MCRHFIGDAVVVGLLREDKLPESVKSTTQALILLVYSSAEYKMLVIESPGN
jgi:hypothetical protein